MGISALPFLLMGVGGASWAGSDLRMIPGLIDIFDDRVCGWTSYSKPGVLKIIFRE